MSGKVLGESTRRHVNGCTGRQRNDHSNRALRPRLGQQLSRKSERTNNSDDKSSKQTFQGAHGILLKFGGAWIFRPPPHGRWPGIRLDRPAAAVSRFRFHKFLSVLRSPKSRSTGGESGRTPAWLRLDSPKLSFRLR